MPYHCPLNPGQVFHQPVDVDLTGTFGFFCRHWEGGVRSSISTLIVTSTSFCVFSSFCLSPFLCLCLAICPCLGLFLCLYLCLYLFLCPSSCLCLCLGMQRKRLRKMSGLGFLLCGLLHDSPPRAFDPEYTQQMDDTLEEVQDQTEQRRHLPATEEKKKEKKRTKIHIIR